MSDRRSTRAGVLQELHLHVAPPEHNETPQRPSHVATDLTFTVDSGEIDGYLEVTGTTIPASNIP